MKTKKLFTLHFSLFTILYSLFTIHSLSAQSLSNIPAAFADIGLGARVMAMGGAGTALADDATAMLWNPANIHLNDKKFNLNCEFTELYTLYNYSFIGATQKIKEGFKIGAGAIYSGDEAMDEITVILTTSITGKYIYEYFIPNMPYLTIGSNLKLLYSSFGNNPEGASITGTNEQVSGSAIGAALDFGIYCRVTPRNTVAVAYKNAYSYIQWDSSNDAGSALGKYDEDLPPQLSFGYMRTENRFKIAVDLNKALNSDTEDRLALGIEWILIPKWMDLRIGYNSEMLTGDNKRYSAGVGFHIPMKTNTISLDAAYQIQTQWEGHDTFYLSMGYNF